MKKIFAFIVAVMMFAMVGCQCTNQAPALVEEEQVEVVVDSTACDVPQVVDTLAAPVEEATEEATTEVVE